MSFQTLPKEMREFKDEMREYKGWSKNQIILMNRQWGGDLANKMGSITRLSSFYERAD